MSSPLRNRVLPDGSIAALPARGTLMGNRGGRLHGDDRTLGHRRWVTRQWIACTLRFKDRRRTVMGGGYTELFFLDEVTALAAGHRPCFECRRAEAVEFAARFPEGPLKAPQMDRILHGQRTGPRDTLPLSALPDGAMARLDGRFWARRGALMLEWSPEGYVSARAADDTPAEILTPAAIRAALSAGYAAAFHPSAAPLSPQAG